MFKSSIVFLFTATLLSAGQSSQPAQTQPKPALPAPPARQQPQQPSTIVAPNSGVTPDSEKNAAPQDPPFRKIKVAFPPKPKPERFPTGILDKATPA
ncbi:MAG TPA: hypothetical protein VJW20_07765 [Candidatus Angelobacter sp.]|nr:hypothetical protein [Candidatus Angelobacter sp.]